MSQIYTLTTQQLADRLQTNPASIRTHRTGKSVTPVLDGLPDPIQVQPRLIWLVADIEAWLDSRRTFRAPPSPPQNESVDPVVVAVKKGRGRPRKEKEEGGAA